MCSKTMLDTVSPFRCSRCPRSNRTRCAGCHAAGENSGLPLLVFRKPKSNLGTESILRPVGTTASGLADREIRAADGVVFGDGWQRRWQCEQVACVDPSLPQLLVAPFVAPH